MEESPSFFSALVSAEVTVFSNVGAFFCGVGFAPQPEATAKSAKLAAKNGVCNVKKRVFDIFVLAETMRKSPIRRHLCFKQGVPFLCAKTTS